MRLFIRIILCILNILASGCLLCCLATQYIKPDTFPYFEILALLFPVIFFVNIAFAIFWLLAKDHKFYCLISLATILLSIPTAYKYYGFSKKETVHSEPTTSYTLKVMSYNVMGFMYHTWRKSTEVKQQIFLYIRKVNPDIICFQEYHNDTKENFIVLDSLIQQLNLAYVHHNSTYSVGPHHYQGNLICSRYPIAASGTMNYKKSGNAAIWADIVVGTDTIRVYNTHLESYRLSYDNKQSINEIGKLQPVEVEEIENLTTRLKKAIIKRRSQVDELSKSIKESPYPVITCGDFNSPPCSYSYHQIIEAGNLQDAFLEAGSGIGATFNWWPQLRLDYILVDPKFSCHKFRRIGLKVSDHFPVSCEVDILPTKE